METRKFIRERTGGVVDLRLELTFDIDRTLTKEDNIIISEQMEGLIKQLDFQTVKTDPQGIEKSENIKARLLECFGINKIYTETIPNEYCSEPCCYHSPWLIVTTAKGRIKIGWRKRVIKIDWSNSDIKKESYELFAEEDVTKGLYFIHAWNYEKAKEYINTLMNCELLPEGIK